jgi:diacylglycerol kinase
MPETARHLRESGADLTPRPSLPRGEGEADARRRVPPGEGESEPNVPPRPTFLRSFVYAWRGIIYAVHTQRNMRVHIALAVVAIALGVALRISPVEFAMIFVAITGVFIAEMVNTVAEACVDLATQTYHPLARVAKDVAAGAVLVSAILAVVIALFIYVPHIAALLR